MLLNMHISVVLEFMQEQWAWFIIWPPDVLYCSLLSLCVRMERILLILLETEGETDGWTTTLTHLSFLLISYLNSYLSVTLFPPFLILTMYFLYAHYCLELMWIWTLISVFVSVYVWVPLYLSPSCRHTTSASLSSHWSSHIEPHCPAWKTSTVPSDPDWPPTSRIGSATIAETHTSINPHIYT